MQFQSEEELEDKGAARMNKIIVHPKFVEIHGIFSVLAMALGSRHTLLQSADRKYLMFKEVHDDSKPATTLPAVLARTEEEDPFPPEAT